MQNLTNYMCQLEKSIAGTFVNDRLAVHLVGGVQGPHTLTFAMKLYQSTKANVAKALSLAGAVEATTGISPVRIYTEQGAILVEVPSPQPVVIHGNTLHGAGLAVPVGMTSRRAVTGVDFGTNPHLLLVGPTGRGKTTAARAIAYHLARQNRTRQARFIVSTFKPKDWKAFANMAHTMAVITSPGESASMIRWLTGVMYERTQREIDTPHLFIFLDDLLNLLSIEDMSDELGQISSLGRGAGIHLIIGTQRLNERGTGSAIVTGNIPTRLVFGTASAQDASAFSGRGESGAEKLGRYPGDALLLTDGGAQRLAVAYVTDSDLAALPAPLHPDAASIRPWQSKTTKTGSATEGAPDAILDENTPFPGEVVLGGSPPVESGSMGGSEVVLTGPATTAAERELVLETYRRTGSKNQTYKLIWGYKSDKTLAWLNEILEGTL